MNLKGACFVICPIVYDCYSPDGSCPIFLFCICICVLLYFCTFVFLYFFHCVAAVGPRTPLLLSLYTSFLIPIQFQEVQQGLLLLVVVTSVSAKLTCYCSRNSMPMVWFLLTTQHQRLAHLKKKRKSVIILSEADYIRLDMDQTVICY